MSPSLVLLWLERTGLVGDSLAITVCRLGGREGDVPPAGREDGGRGEEGRLAWGIGRLRGTSWKASSSPEVSIFASAAVSVLEYV